MTAKIFKEDTVQRINKENYNNFPWKIFKMRQYMRKEKKKKNFVPKIKTEMTNIREKSIKGLKIEDKNKKE